MDSAGPGAFHWRYLDEIEKRISELLRSVELAREQAVEAIHEAVKLLLDGADAHEQAATAYELAASNGGARDLRERATQHRQIAAARRATAASMASRSPASSAGDDSDMLGCS